VAKPTTPALTSPERFSRAGNGVKKKGGGAHFGNCFFARIQMWWIFLGPRSEIISNTSYYWSMCPVGGWRCALRRRYPDVLLRHTVALMLRTTSLCH
jgi:hypothetical protein